MHNILLQLYHGELTPSSSYSDRFPEHREKRMACYQKHMDFLDRLQAIDPDLQREMEQLLDEQLSVDMLDLPEAFAEGFCLGAKIMIEICTPNTSS